MSARHRFAIGDRVVRHGRPYFGVGVIVQIDCGSADVRWPDFRKAGWPASIPMLGFHARRDLRPESYATKNVDTSADAKTMDLLIKLEVRDGE